MAQKAESKKRRRRRRKSREPPQSIRWDDSKMTSNYANVCNVSQHAEEMTLLFGTNQSWYAGQELTVQLTNRIIMNPMAAKRSWCSSEHRARVRIPFRDPPIEIVSHRPANSNPDEAVKDR